MRIGNKIDRGETGIEGGDRSIDGVKVGYGKWCRPFRKMEDEIVGNIVNT